MAAHCEECDGCCRIFEVKEINKPFAVPCKHLGHTPDGPGCKIYLERPDACCHYVCVWLDSRRRLEVEPMPDELRPDRCKCVLGWPWASDRSTMFAYPYPDFPNAWKEYPVKNYLQMILSRGAKVLVYINSEHVVYAYGSQVLVGSEKEFADILTELKLGQLSAPLAGTANVD